MAKNVNKNKWARKALSRIIGSASSALSAPSRAISAVKSRKGERKLTAKMMRKAGMVPGVMGDTKYDTAFNTIRNKVRQGNLSGARDYVRSQTKKIAQEKKNK